MNKRRFVIFAFIAVALLCMGLGYATLVDTLTINGTVGTTADNVENEEVFNVEFTQVTTPTVVDVDSAVAATATVNKDTATLVVTNMGIYGESVSAVYTVKNFETSAAYKANVEAVVSITKGGVAVSASECPFTVSALFGSAASTTIANNTTADLTVVVTMKNVLLSASAEYVVTITLNATATQA